MLLRDEKFIGSYVVTTTYIELRISRWYIFVSIYKPKKLPHDLVLSARLVVEKRMADWMLVLKRKDAMALCLVGNEQNHWQKKSLHSFWLADI